MTLPIAIRTSGCCMMRERSPSCSCSPRSLRSSKTCAVVHDSSEHALPFRYQLLYHSGCGARLLVGRKKVQGVDGGNHHDVPEHAASLADEAGSHGSYSRSSMTVKLRSMPSPTGSLRYHSETGIMVQDCSCMTLPGPSPRYVNDPLPCRRWRPYVIHHRPLHTSGARKSFLLLQQMRRRRDCKLFVDRAVTLCADW